MSSDTKFIDGLLAKPPHERAPEYVKAKLSIKRQELIAWLQAQQGDWINADIKVSQNGKWYVAVDEWKPDSKRAKREEEPKNASVSRDPQDDFADDDIPF